MSSLNCFLWNIKLLLVKFECQSKLHYNEIRKLILNHKELFDDVNKLYEKLDNLYIFKIYEINQIQILHNLNLNILKDYEINDYYIEIYLSIMLEYLINNFLHREEIHNKFINQIINHEFITII
jgi:hypothetical protein